MLCVYSFLLSQNLFLKFGNAPRRSEFVPMLLHRRQPACTDLPGSPHPLPPSSRTTVHDRGTLITRLGNKARRDGHVGPGEGASVWREERVFREITPCFMTHTDTQAHSFTLCRFRCTSFMDHLESFHSKSLKN